jgi:chromosome segregation ATPase
MKQLQTWLRRLAATLLLALPLHAADEAPDPTAKLRDQLRAVMLQLRTSQTESANAQAEKIAAEQKFAALEQETKALKARNAALDKQAAQDKATAEKTTADLEGKLADSKKQVILYQEALEKWKTGYQKAAEIARTKEEERAKLADQTIIDRRDIADLQRKNIALFNTANEILDRYESYSLGKALSAREPFIGTTRVKVENLVQGYKDKILDNRIAAPAAKP